MRYLNYNNIKEFMMQTNITQIITVLNDFTMADELLAKTFDFAQKYHARVEILYVHETPFFDVPDFFSTEVAGTLEKEKIKKEIEAKVATFKPSVTPAIFVKIDDTQDRVWALARENKETLIITAYHEGITEKLVSKVTQPVLVLKTATQSYKKIALVVDAGSDTPSCIKSVKQHFEESMVELFYDYRYIVDPGMEADLQNVHIIEEAQRNAFEALKKEHGLDGKFFIDGDFLGTQMSEYLKNKNFDLLYTCSHGDDFFVSDNLAMSLLDTLHCDMLISSR